MAERNLSKLVGLRVSPTEHAAITATAGARGHVTSAGTPNVSGYVRALLEADQAFTPQETTPCDTP